MQTAIGNHGVVVVAGDCGNLETVAKVLREQYPTRDIVITADNDHSRLDGNNVGVISAQKAAQAVGGSVIIPEALANTKGTDFNDLMRVKGLEEVGRIVKAHLEALNKRKQKKHSR